VEGGKARGAAAAGETSRTIDARQDGSRLETVLLKIRLLADAHLNGRFARAVFAHDEMDLAGVDGKRAVAQGNHPAKALLDACEFQ